MGCDIHAYIEVYSKEDAKKSKDCFVDSFGGEIYLGRDYNLFGLLAGVRALCAAPVVPPRGIPTDPHLSFDVRKNYYINLVDSEEKVPAYDELGLPQMSRKEFEQMIDRRLFPPKNGAKSLYVSDNKVVNPDWHTPTWLTLPELQEVRKLYLIEHVECEGEISGKQKKELIKHISSIDSSDLMRYTFVTHESPRLLAVLHAMNALEKACAFGDDTITRFVCWFDS